MRVLYVVICLWMMFGWQEMACAKHQPKSSSKAHVIKVNKHLSKSSKLSKTKKGKSSKLAHVKPAKKKQRTLAKHTHTKLKAHKKTLTKSKVKKTKKTLAKSKRSQTKFAKSKPKPSTKKRLTLAKHTLPILAFAQPKLVNEREKIAADLKEPLLRTKVEPLPIKSERFKSWHSFANTQALSRELSEAIRSDGANADVGVFIKSMKYGDVLYTHNINHALTPASTLKVLTAEAGLIYLGSEYRFSTQLLTDGKQIKDGVLQGNLYIVLGGDPTLTFNDLKDLLLALENAQIRAITGNVYIDNTAYDDDFYGPDWEWEDKGYCYAAPISASIINRNCIFFKITSSSGGHLAQIDTYPRYFYPAIRNSVITKSYGFHACGVKLSQGSESRIDIDGCIPSGRSLGVSYVVSDVFAYNRALFRSLLRRMGIHVYGSITFGQAPETLYLLGSHASKPLRLLINDMLKKSDNIIAGAIFKKLGQLYTHKPGSWENGSYAVKQILSTYAGMQTAGLRILDGSGLSPSNLTTPLQMMQVLSFAYHHPETSEEFMTALPIAGVDGTLKHRMTNIPRKIRAKTGTISGVVSLAGYAISADKEPLAFVIIINGNKGLSWRYKSMEDRIALILTRYKRR